MKKKDMCMFACSCYDSNFKYQQLCYPNRHRT